MEMYKIPSNLTPPFGLISKFFIEMTFCGKLNRGVYDQNVRIYCIYKFLIAYNGIGALIGFD